MPKGYVLMTEAIHDLDGMHGYERASMPSIVEHRLRVLDADEHVQILEGSWHGNRTVLVEWESVEATRDWYESNAYQTAKPLRLAAAGCNAVLLTGFELPTR